LEKKSTKVAITLEPPEANKYSWVNNFYIKGEGYFLFGTIPESKERLQNQNVNNCKF